MTSRPPEKRRPHVTPIRDMPLPDERDDRPPGEPDRARRFVSRMEAATDSATQRRRRRLQRAADGKIKPPVAIPRGMPFRIYISMRIFSGLIIVALVAVLYILLSR